MSKEQRTEIARKGGLAAHRKGTAHEWTREEARIAGKKGGVTRHMNRCRLEAASTATETSTTTDDFIKQ